MRRICFALALLAGLLCAPPAQAQPAATVPPGSMPPDGVLAAGVPRLPAQARVSLLTILPGDSPAAAFGHSAFRVRAPALGLDRTYNYGTYDFDAPYFIPKFTYGRLDYLLSTAPFRPFLRRYRFLGRPVIEQELRLSRGQAQRLFAFLEWNAQPGRRSYRYDFLFDNCATRLRDALADALGGSLRFPLAELPRRSFREHLDRSVASMPLVDFGFDIALGLPTDRTASPREAMFLPEYLMEAFAGATIGPPGDVNAARRPLVAHTDTLFWRAGAQFPARPAFPWPAVAAWTLFAALAALTAWRYRQGRPPLRWVDVVLFGMAGLAGVVVWFLAFASEHVVTRRNLNVAWALPTHLAFAGALLAGYGGGRLGRGYLLGAGAAASVLILGWPLWPQDLHAATFPLVAMLALRCARRGLAPRLRTPRPRRQARPEAA